MTTVKDTASQPLSPYRTPAAAGSPVSAFDEWSRLEEVIVGRVSGSVIPDEPASMLQATIPEKYVPYFLANAGKPFPAEQIAAAERQLDHFVQVLTDEGVRVRRPDVPGDTFAKPIRGETWETKGGMYAAMPRDNLLVVGDRIIEAPMSWRSRQNEGIPYAGLLGEYRDGGARWIQAPRPKLTDALYTPNWTADDHEFRSVITEAEPTFDAADFMRFGRDIVGQLSHVTNKAGVRWLRETLGPEYRVHIIQFADAHPMHIDATIMPLKPGLMLVNPERVPKALAERMKRSLFKGWDLVEVPRPVMPDDHVLYMTSKWINMNVVSIDEERVLVEAEDGPMTKFFKDLGLKPIAVPFRHFNTFGGSFHCATCDVRRVGGYDTWLSDADDVVTSF